jgi:hypothetical protein
VARVVDSIEVPRPDVTAHLTAISELVRVMGEQSQMPGYYLDIIALYDRCRSMFGGLRTLLTADFSHEAAALAGPLFVDSLVLAELAAADERRRARLVIGLELQGVRDVEGIILAGNDTPEDAANVAARLASRRAELIEAAGQLGVDAREWSPRDDVEELAKRHGRAEEYVAKLVSDQFVHGSSLARAQRYSSTEEPKEILVGGPHAKVDDWSDGTGLFAATSMLHAARAACSIFSWPEPPEVAELLVESERLSDVPAAPQEDEAADVVQWPDDPKDPQTRQVVVVMSARADALWRDTDPAMVISDFPTSVGPVTISYRTAYFDEGLESTVPREMWIEAAGGDSTTTFVEVITAYANAAASFIPVIAFCTNAYVGDVEPKIAFDNAPGKVTRDYFQSFVPERRPAIPLPGRRVPSEAVVAVLKAVQASPSRDRLRRAMGQYALALSHWLRGQETLALAFLYIGMETLVPVALERECARLGLTVDELMQSWGITDNPAAVRRNELNGAIRQRVLFRGNSALAAQAKRASDGFEHGFLDFAAMRSLAVQARDETARLLRRAILECADVPTEHTEKLLSPPFDVPLHSFVTRYIWGTILGDGDDPAPPDKKYPSLEWRARLGAYKRHEDDTVTFTPEETPTVRFAEGFAFRPRRYEAWGPEGIRRIEQPDARGDDPSRPQP